MSDRPIGEIARSAVVRAVQVALEEDGAANDVTTQALVTSDQRASATLLAKSEGVIAGLSVAATVFALIDESVNFEACLSEGGQIAPGVVCARVSGSLASMLSSERVALNFLQRLSGIATLTSRMVDAIAGLPVVILDTRKTTPGLRELERYAVRVGGGQNHRFNLSDAILIKDNHLAAARLRGWRIADVVRAAQQAARRDMKVEIEVTTIQEAREALKSGARSLLLDNMSIEDMRTVVSKARAYPGVTVEASGGTTLENVRPIAETGVDFISVGALTHSALALDISLEVEIE